MSRKRTKDVETVETDTTGIVEQQYELIDVDTVDVHPKNPRRGDVSVIRELIRENKFYGAIVVQRSTRFVLVGNHRLLAARAEGLKKIPGFWIDVDNQRALKILSGDNRASDRGTYDDSLLKDLLTSMESDFIGTGYDQNDLDSLIRRLTPPDDFPSYDADIPTKCKCPKCGYEW